MGGDLPFLFGFSGPAEKRIEEAEMVDEAINRLRPKEKFARNTETAEMGSVKCGRMFVIGQEDSTIPIHEKSERISWVPAARTTG